MTLSDTDEFRLRDDLVVEEIDGEVVVLDLAGDKYFGLNSTSAQLVWQFIDDEATLAEIATGLADHFDISQETARADAAAFIGQLLESGLATRHRTGESDQ